MQWNYLFNKIGTCPHVEVHLKLHDEVQFFVQPCAMKNEQKLVIGKEMNNQEKLGIIKKGLTGYGILV